MMKRPMMRRKIPGLPLDFEKTGLALLAASVILASVLAIFVPAPSLQPIGYSLADWLQGRKAVEHVSVTHSFSPRGKDVTVYSAEGLSKFFDSIDYQVDAVREEASVPAVYLVNLPNDIESLPTPKDRKEVFVAAVLPLILAANQEIMAEREYLLGLKQKLDENQILSKREYLWLESLATRYESDANDLDALLVKVDVVPPSMALAQAALETGWGTSRFAVEGNAIFGEWIWPDKENQHLGLLPMNRDHGKTHLIRAFGTLYDSVKGYMENLNTHRAYASFRALRADSRKMKKEMDPYALVATLLKYSERGSPYIKQVKTIMRVNRLGQFDKAQLAAENALELAFLQN